MGDFIQPKSPLNLNIGETKSIENFGHHRIILQNISCEAETRVETTQEEVNQLGDMPPKESSQEGLNTENVGQIGEIEINEGEDTILVEQKQDEQLSSLGVETIRRTIVPPKN